MSLNVICYTVLFALFVIGCFLVFHKKKDNYIKDHERRLILTRNLSLRDEIDIINGKNNSGTSKIRNYFFGIKLLLAKMNKLDNYPKLILVSILGVVLSIIICAIIDNFFLVILLGPILALLPFELTKRNYKKHIKLIDEELETALSLITISYNRTQNLITAINECLYTLPPTVKPFFDDFIFEVTSVSANVNTALIHLKTKIENQTFQRWVDRLVVCQDDRSAIPSLQTYVNEFADNRAIQNELDAEIYSSKIELYMMVGFVIFTPVLLFFLQRDAFNHLMNDTIGKITFAVAMTICVIAVLVCNKVAKPVKFRGNKD